MTKLMLIEKAKKIAARMQSPYEHEAIVAATMLRKLLDEHGLSPQDIGIKEYDSRKAQTSGPNVPSSPVYTSQDVGFTRVDEIVEVHYKHGTSSLARWHFDFFTNLAKLYNVDIIYYRDYSKIIGYDIDLKIFQGILVYMKGFLESQIASRGYSSEHEIFGYVQGYFDRLRSSIENEISPEATKLAAVKKGKISEYLRKYRFNTKSLVPDQYSSDAYAAGRADAEPRLAIGRK